MGWLPGGQGGAVLVRVFAGVVSLRAWWNGDKAVLRQHGAMLVTDAEAPDSVQLVRQLANCVRLPLPRSRVLATAQPIIINPLGAPRMDVPFSTHLSTQGRIDLLQMKVAPAPSPLGRSLVPAVRRG